MQILILNFFKLQAGMSLVILWSLIIYIDYTSNGMIISIRFENPLAISIYSSSIDKIEIEIIQSEFFNSGV